MNQDRRSFLKTIGKAGMGATVLANMPVTDLFSVAGKDLFFDISLAQWSFHKALFADEMDNLDFASTAQNEFGITAVEYVNQFFKDKAGDKSYLAEMKKRSDDAGVRNVLIMCDGEGALGDADSEKREEAVENHYKWVEAAKYLGCHSIRVNAQSSGSYEEQMQRAADGLRSLTEFADQHDINVIVENHGGLSSNAEWLVGVMKQVDHPRCGTLPDFGNFNISQNESYDRYKGTSQLMPYAKGVSAKSYAFDSDGNETTIDFEKMLQIVKDAGYTGYIGIEYEGSNLSETEGIRATKQLLEKVGAKLTQ